MGFDWRSWYRFAFSVLCISVVAVGAAYFVSSLLALLVAGVVFVVLFLLRGMQPGAVRQAANHKGYVLDIR